MSLPFSTTLWIPTTCVSPALLPAYIRPRGEPHKTRGIALFFHSSPSPIQVHHSYPIASRLTRLPTPTLRQSSKGIQLIHQDRTGHARIGSPLLRWRAAGRQSTTPHPLSLGTNVKACAQRYVRRASSPRRKGSTVAAVQYCGTPLCLSRRLRFRWPNLACR